MALVIESEYGFRQLRSDSLWYGDDTTLHGSLIEAK